MNNNLFVKYACLNICRWLFSDQSAGCTHIIFVFSAEMAETAIFFIALTEFSIKKQ